MQEIKDFVSGIFSTYKERVSSPLIGSFTLTFLLYNWRPIVFILWSDWPIHCRIEHIDQVYSDRNSIIIPFAIAVGYVILLPYVNLGIDTVLAIPKKFMFSRENDDRGKVLKAQKEYAKVEKEIADIRSGSLEISALQDRIEILQKENLNINTSNLEGLQKIADLESKINELIDELQDKKIEYNNEIRIRERLIPVLMLMSAIDVKEFRELAIKISSVGGDLSKVNIYNEKIFQNFKLLGLIKVDDTTVELTTVGRVLYTLLPADPGF